ncbi:SpoIIE family protein phosphatase [Streptomyces sp. NBC_00690]|uniref:SpoIIE family protein phosphatase n=1 Tax=Streptomyces sp. NBC_00690 TaxID=2975808 RepID=UPI002E283077|nr:SpoIIE family protein phosphatase [Streptomyces sp. NBC_00690]
MVTTDSGGTVTEWDERAHLLLGYHASEAVGRSAAEMFGKHVSHEADLALRTRTRWMGTAPVRHRDGHPRSIWLLARRLDGDRGVEWLLSASPAPDPLAEEDRTLAEWGFNQSPHHIGLFDTDSRVMRVNTALERGAALPEDRLRGLLPSEIVVSPQSPLVDQAMREVIETGEQRQVDTYARVPGETRERAWAVSIAPLTNPEGVVCGASLTASDRTEHYWARRRLQLVNEAGSRIGSTLDITRTAQELVDVAMPRFTDYAAVDLLSFIHQGGEPPSGPPTGPVRMRRTAMGSVSSELPDGTLHPGDPTDYPMASPVAEALARGRPAMYEITESALTHWAVHDPERATRIRLYGAHSIMVVPMRARGVTLGVALFARKESPTPFQSDDMLLAEEITARAAVCIDNARRYERERQTAVTLQRSLLPQALPEQAALEIASRYLPAGGQAGVGGDWFDIIPLSGARVGLVVGDVVGHGIQAAATMGRLRGAVRTLADIDLPPDELLTHLDDVVIRLGAEDFAAEAETTGDIGATCLYAVYDPVVGRCSIASAGHPLPAVVRPDGTAHTLDAPIGPPLGLGALPFETAEFDLPEGSLLALYTDGLIEARSHDVDAGRATLLRVLDCPEDSTPSLDDLCDDAFAALLPDRPDDDSVLLIARTRRLDEGQVATWEVPSDPAAVAQARTDAVRRLADWELDDDIRFTAELVVSELVTNAIRYGLPPIQLRLIHERAVICEVSDASYTSPRLRRARVFDEGGRGLLLVAQLTQRWGTRYTPTGKTIWADISALTG